LLSEREKLTFYLKDDLENLGRTYRKRGDININLYLTEYVLENKESNYYKEAVDDYQESIKLLTKANSSMHLSEAILAHGNAIKEQFLPLHKKDGKDFTENEEKAKAEYKKCIDLTLNINYLRYYFFATLEQMNLEVRKKVRNCNTHPKRIVIFHSLESPESHQFLKGVYYFAYQSLIEIWEYNYGRVPDSDKNEHFIGDRLLDASGVVFLCSSNYDKNTKQIVRFEIQETKKLIDKNDPVKVFALDIGNSKLLDELREFSTMARKDDFEEKIGYFFKELKDIYHCRKFRCEN